MAKKYNDGALTIFAACELMRDRIEEVGFREVARLMDKAPGSVHHAWCLMEHPSKMQVGMLMDYLNAFGLDIGIFKHWDGYVDNEIMVRGGES